MPNIGSEFRGDAGEWSPVADMDARRGGEQRDLALWAALAVFAAFVLVGGFGGWEWFIGSAQAGRDASQAGMSQTVHVKQPPSSPF
jgi:hypothetical protein